MSNDTLIRGDSRTYYTDVTVLGVPLDLTGYTAWFTAKFSPTDADGSAAIRKGMSGGLTGVSFITEPVSGSLSRIKIVLVPADTASLAPKRVTLQYDVQIKTPTGDIYTITSGEILIVPDVTITTT